MQDTAGVGVAVNAIVVDPKIVEVADELGVPTDALIGALVKAGCKLATFRVEERKPLDLSDYIVAGVSPPRWS